MVLFREQRIFIPDQTRIGSTTGSALKAESATMLGIRRGSNLTLSADLLARTYVAGVATQNNVSGAVTCDLTLGSVFILNLTGSITSFAFSNVPADGAHFEVHFIQDATGSRTLSGVNGAVKLAGGSLVLTTTASKRDVVRFTAHAGGSWEVSRSLNMG